MLKISEKELPTCCRYCGCHYLALQVSGSNIKITCRKCGKRWYELHKDKENDMDMPRFKCVICKLVNKDGREICSGGAFAHDEHARDDTSFEEFEAQAFEEFEAQANESLLRNLKKTMAVKLPSCANKTQKEMKGILDALIALEGYKLEWFYCGWEGK